MLRRPRECGLFLFAVLSRAHETRCRRPSLPDAGRNWNGRDLERPRRSGCRPRARQAGNGYCADRDRRSGGAPMAHRKQCSRRIGTTPARTGVQWTGCILCQRDLLKIARSSSFTMSQASAPSRGSSLSASLAISAMLMVHFASTLSSTWPSLSTRIFSIAGAPPSACISEPIRAPSARTAPTATTNWHGRALFQNRADRIARPSEAAIASAVNHNGSSIKMRSARGSRGGRLRQGYGTNRRLGAKHDRKPLSNIAANVWNCSTGLEGRQSPIGRATLRVSGPAHVFPGRGREAGLPPSSRGRRAAQWASGPVVDELIGRHAGEHGTTPLARSRRCRGYGSASLTCVVAMLNESC